MGSRDTDFPEIEQRIKLRETPAPRIVTSREPSVEPKNDRVPARTEAPAAPASQRIAAPPAQEQAPAPPPSRPAASGREEVKPLMAGRNPTTTATVRTAIPNRPSEKQSKIVEQTVERVDRVEKRTTLQLDEAVRLAAPPKQQKPIDAPVQRGVTTLRESAMPVLSSAPQALPVPGWNDAAPEIHVSIGRVIVNARPASTPQPKTAAAAPTIRLTLDQYLRQRGGRS